MKEKVYVGNLAQSMDKSNAVSVDRVKVWINDALYYRSPNVTDAQWDAMTGQIVETKIPFGTQTIADNILSQLNGYTYVPMTVRGASVDPCAELGDGITVGGVYGIISTLDSTLNDRNASDVINPEINALQQDYDYTESAVLKQERQGVAIEEKVSFVDLETSGRTTINGDNITTGHLSADRIQSGTLTLGGQNNQYGQLYIKDGSNNTIGEWTNDGITIENGKMKICSSVYGTFTKNYFPISKTGSDYDLATDLLFYTFNPETYLPQLRTLVGDATLDHTKILELWDFDRDGYLTSDDALTCKDLLTAIDNSGKTAQSTHYKIYSAMSGTGGNYFAVGSIVDMLNNGTLIESVAYNATTISGDSIKTGIVKDESNIGATMTTTQRQSICSRLGISASSDLSTILGQICTLLGR